MRFSPFLSNRAPACAFWVLVPALALAQPIPRKDKPPVVFLNGYQEVCAGSTFASTFGIADQVLLANGEVSLFFNNCTVPGKPAIEELGRAFGNYLAGLKYDDGQPVTTVDVVAHSMGGLILRSYLSGKQPGSAIFQPPAAVKVRKAVFVATPHFGTPVGLVLGGDVQVQELSSGSKFLFDLATWNQGTDDLRGVDALAIVGNGGTGRLTMAGFDDGLLALSSGSLSFVTPGRTRVLPFCHIAGGGLITFAGLCDPTAKGIAEIQSASDPQAQILISFLNGTTGWQLIGTPAEANPALSASAGLDLETHSAADVLLPMDSASANAKALSIPFKDVAYSDLLPAGPQTLKSVSGTVTTTGSVTLPPGGYKAVVLKPGPIIGRVFPAAAALFPLSVAPGEFVAIYGDALAGSTAQAASVNFPTQLADTQVLVNDAPALLYFVAPQQIDAIIPENAAGLMKLKVQTTSGVHTVNVLVEPAVPAIFTQNGTGAGPASASKAGNNQVVSGKNPLRSGDYVQLFLTGLGVTSNRGGLEWANQQPAVTVGGRPCAVSYAGRAPGYRGLDQINCQIAAGSTPDPAAPVVVYSGARTSNTATLVLQ